MKRIHLFEFEDLSWFPNWLRVLMTQYINTIHKLLGSSQQIAEILGEFLTHTNERHILDLCSGSGGPMPEVKSLLEEKHAINNLRLTFSDLYPNLVMARRLNQQVDHSLSYRIQPINAVSLGTDPAGIRTMICSFHHMDPKAAKTILLNAQAAKQPIFIYEISDNSYPKWLWWIGIPVNILSVLFITPLVRPVSWQQLLFTYVIPILPLTIAWDGAVSNARTYTLEDLDTLLPDDQNHQYAWEKNSVKGKGGDKLYVLGYPR